MSLIQIGSKRWMLCLLTKPRTPKNRKQMSQNGALPGRASDTASDAAVLDMGFWQCTYDGPTKWDVGLYVYAFQVSSGRMRMHENGPADCLGLCCCLEGAFGHRAGFRAPDARLGKLVFGTSDKSGHLAGALLGPGVIRQQPPLMLPERNQTDDIHMDRPMHLQLLVSAVLL